MFGMLLGVSVMEMFADGEVFPTDCPFRIRDGRRVTSDARVQLFVFFSVYLFVLFFKRCFFPALPFRSDFSFSFCRAYISCLSTVPIHILVTHYTSTTPAFSPATQPTPVPLVPSSIVRHTLATRFSHPQQRHDQKHPCQRAHLLPCRGREA